LSYYKIVDDNARGCSTLDVNGIYYDERFSSFPNRANNIDGIKSLIRDELARYEREQAEWDAAYAKAEAVMHEALKPFNVRHNEIRSLKAALERLEK
jgi:hypothetical protein